MLGLQRKDWNGSQKKATAKAIADAKAADKTKTAPPVINAPFTHALKDYDGLYTNPGYGTMDISLKGDSLFVNLKRSQFWLRHARYDNFELLNVDKNDGIDTTAGGGTMVQFVLNKAGEIESLECELQGGVKAIVFRRNPRMVPLKAEELKKFVGDYELAGYTAKVYLKNENILYVFVPGQPEYETVPTGNNEFKLKVLSGYSVKFEVDDKGVVTGVSFIQPNGTFKAKKKL